MKVEVVPHNPDWKNLFAAEAKQWLNLLNSDVIAIHHIGSTAIPNIHAKPIIDLLIVVKDIDNVDKNNTAITAENYDIMGEFGIVGRRYFRKHNSAGNRTHHIHIYQQDSPEIQRHLAFRDYMITHPEDAKEYSKLKQELALKHPEDIESYMDGKDQFIKDIDQKAVEWVKNNP
ncbi:MAG: GrpB family protein [Microcoleaceae cyanobacterium]